MPPFAASFSCSFRQINGIWRKRVGVESSVRQNPKELRGIARLWNYASECKGARNAHGLPTSFFHAVSFLAASFERLCCLRCAGLPELLACKCSALCEFQHGVATPACTFTSTF